MPAWNTAKYIGEAIDSVTAQTFPDWELIIVDDCSTDSTAGIANERAAADERIRVEQTSCQSGGAYVPRLQGVMSARAELIVCVDSDDTIAPDYLAALMQRREHTGADIVQSRLVMMPDSDVTVPPANFDIAKVYSGKKALEAAYAQMALNSAGQLMTRLIYTDALQRFRDDYRDIYADELLSLKILACAGRVAIADVNYNYRQHSESVTHRFSFRQFGHLIVAQHVRRHFSAMIDGEALEYTNYVTLLSATISYLRRGGELLPEERSEALSLMRSSWQSINWRKISGFSALKRGLLGTNFQAFVMLIRAYLMARRLLGVTLNVKIKF